MSLYNWGFVVRQRNRSWWKFRRGNLENCRFLITKTTIMDRRLAVNSRRYITFDRGVMIALIHFQMLHTYTEARFQCQIYYHNLFFQNHVQVIPEIYVYHTQPSPMPLTSFHHHHHHHHPSRPRPTNMLQQCIILDLQTCKKKRLTRTPISIVVFILLQTR